MNIQWSVKLGAIAGLGVLAFIVAVVGFLVAVQPQRTKLRSVEAQIATAQAQFAAMHAAPGRKPQINAAELFQLSRAMPKADDMPGILLSLSQLATVSHVSLISVTPRPRVALADGSSAVPVNVTIGGNWTEVTSFLRHVRDQVALRGSKLAVGGRVFDVDNVQLTSETTSPPLQAVLLMNAFDYGAPPSPTATAGTQAATTATTTTSSSSQQAASSTGSGG